MTLLLMILVVLAVATTIGITLRDVFADRGPRRAPQSHYEDPMFRAPAARI